MRVRFMRMVHEDGSWEVREGTVYEGRFMRVRFMRMVHEGKVHEDGS